MRSLEERLRVIREGAVKRIAAEHREQMHRATAELEAGGAAQRAVGKGDEAPKFSLTDSKGDRVSSDEALAQGPLIVTFFRGHW